MNASASPAILIVDDDPTLLKLLGILLRAENYRVLAADSGEQALALLAVEKPHLVVTDLRMGGMDGMALFDAVRKTYPMLPVIILTAHGTIPEAVEATRRGVFGNEPVKEHPDTEHSIVGLKIPRWDELLLIAARAYELSGLGYVGVDIVLDKDKGPLILELNARPGLAIQIANGNGLLNRLQRIQALEAAGTLASDPEARVAYAKAHFATT